MVDKVQTIKVLIKFLPIVLVITLLTSVLCTAELGVDSENEKGAADTPDLHEKPALTSDRSADSNDDVKDKEEVNEGIPIQEETKEQTLPVVENTESVSEETDDSEKMESEETLGEDLDKIVPENDLHQYSEKELHNSDEEQNVYELTASAEDSNSTWLSWFRYILDPFLEEFKDGIYSRSNYSNTTDNASYSAANKTDVFKVTNETVPPFLNITESDQNTTDSGKKTKFQCTGKNITDNTNATVKIVTSSRLLQLLNFDKNDTENLTDCLVVMFYAPWCQFCAKTAPHYNALSRAFPQLDFVAVDTAQFSNLLARFGTVSVPNILVFHQSRAAVKFNQTERIFENLVSFVKNTTGLEPNTTVNITAADYIGPISSVPTDDPDIFLWLAWLFVILYSSFMFIKSNKGQQWITRIRILWQEHQHID